MEQSAQVWAFCSCPYTAALPPGTFRKASAAAGGVIDAVVFPGLHQTGDELGNGARREEFAALFSRVGGELGDHVLVGIADDVRRAQLARAEIQCVEVLQQVAQDGVLFLHVPQIHLRIEVDRAEHIAQLAAVSVLDMGQRHIDFLPDFRIVPVVVEVIEGGFLVQ